ncbi:hypothetical protein IGI04_030057 [Brassica rapa subsp. trilocularis]|uniref:Uncharacterized protein n=1 Tax=Brassica rapa subsp. trilocularis TaxID=1813537 RepID=A0ABQ7LPL7_BRACM|nr:hypothetical protein IGI04_030057 [Brassica rapa subsp. trilocularis]
MDEARVLYGRCTTCLVCTLALTMHNTYPSSLVDSFLFLIHPIFAPEAIFSLTPPNTSHDQSKSLLDLTSQDRYFRTLLKLD